MQSTYFNESQQMFHSHSMFSEQYYLQNLKSKQQQRPPETDPMGLTMNELIPGNDKKLYEKVFLHH